MQIATIGVDLAKRVFQLHGVGPDGAVVLRQKLRRPQMIAFFAKLPPCLIGMEACGTAHYWAREIKALGHEVRLMPAHYVKAYVKRGKNDAADAAAICEAVTRPTMRFVAIKSEEQQALLVVHRTRELLVRQRTQVVNALRGLLAEFGISEAQGIWHVGRLRAHLEDETVPEPGRTALTLLVEQDPGLAPLQCREQTFSEDPWCWTVNRDGDRRDGGRCVHFWLRPRVCGVA
jgi:transposase